MSCFVIGDDAKLGQYVQYKPNDPTQPRCAQPVHMGKPRFYGCDASGDHPLYVALDFEQYRIAQKGMLIATGAALLFGIALVVVVLKKGH